MDSVDVLQQIKGCIDSKSSFVVHGGAGSGKTQVLKSTLEYLKSRKLDQDVLCITHTNVAADEIRSRVDSGKYSVSTIHSFLNKLCSKYRKNIKEVLHEYFSIEQLEILQESNFDDIKAFKKKRHEEYKKKHKRLAKGLYDLRDEILPKVIGKREFDKDSKAYESSINSKVGEFNIALIDFFRKIDSDLVGYNESKFDSLLEGTYGHDGLIKIATLLLSKYEKLRKILADKYKFILIDEYQDSNKDLIELFVDFNPNLVVGLFGDNMQGIYSDTIGDATYLCQQNKLKEIEKPDNFRCSEQVVKFINSLRLDSLEQKVQLKESENNISERQGEVSLYYSVLTTAKPSSRSSVTEKDVYFRLLENLIETVLSQHPSYKVLLLTNKVVARRVGFHTLYQAFSDRYLEANEKLKNFFEKSYLLDLCKMIQNYEQGNFNYVISNLRSNGCKIQSIDDKLRVKSIFDKLSSEEFSLWKAYLYGVDKGIIKKSSYIDFLVAKGKSLIDKISSDPVLRQFESEFYNGNHTYARMSKILTIDSEVEFNKNVSLIKRKKFYMTITGEDIPFSSLKKYFSYLEEETSFITMHKTKGSSIENVIVVLDNCFWTDYDFSLVYDTPDKISKFKDVLSRKLFYVSCSRCISNLIILQLVENDIDANCINIYDKINKL